SSAPQRGESLSSSAPQRGESLSSSAPQRGESLSSSAPQRGESLSSSAPQRGESPTSAAPRHGEPSGPVTPQHGESSPSAPQRESVPTFRMRAIPEPESRGTGTGAATFPLRAVPSWAAERESPSGREPAADAMAPGTVAAPTGAFGPPPRMDAGSHTAAPDPTRPAEHGRAPEPPAPPVAGRDAHAPGSALSPAPPAARRDAHASGPAPVTPPPAAGRSAPVASGYTPIPDMALPPSYDPDPKPTPARGFDAVAEAVLGDEPITAPGDDTAPALLAEPMGRINDAVRGGRTEEAARLAEETVAEASATLGPEHPEVLRLQELTAYIAYLAGEPVRALRLSLELAGVHRRSGDAEAAYGNVQSAATAWRAVRDPARGLELGRELIDLWTGLAAEGGPAAEEIEQLEPVRTRMERLAQRARASED
ncbi:tetratricopeptide repeat protein, partial [Streptomyces sp. DH24]|uniref:tetratricopeptide repeat protein n=1 Tax=Streptomyces sp. DH24 TaxID=3040123 RepID=UPI002441A411